VRHVIRALSARADLEAIRGYIGQFNPIAAQRLAQHIVTTTETIIGRFPQAARSIGGGRYELPIVRPYTLRYEIDGDTVVILRVRHGARQAEE